MFLIILVVIVLALFMLPGPQRGDTLSSDPYDATPYAVTPREVTLPPPKNKKKVHFAKTRDERIYDKKSRKILRDSVGKT